PVNITNGPQGIALIDPFSIDGFSLARPETIAGIDFSGPIKYYYLLLAVMLAIILINLRLQNSRIGRAWEAIREDEVAARAMGIHTRNLKLLAFAMGASFGGVAGGMFAAIQAFISPESFVLVESIMVVSMVVLGGMGNIWGVILGAVLLSFVPEILRFTVEPAQKQLFGRMIIEPEVIRMLIFGFALVLVMTLRPGGLWPSAVRKREIAARGIGRTFQNIRLFANLSALENVMIGRHVRTRAGVLGAVLRDPATRAEEAGIERRAAELLDYVGIRARANDPAGNLPYGDQRRLEIARALATEPVLL